MLDLVRVKLTCRWVGFALAEYKEGCIGGALQRVPLELCVGLGSCSVFAAPGDDFCNGQTECNLIKMARYRFLRC